MNRPLRILFVDDEPMVLDGLRRALRSMRTQWIMEFATSGAEALARLEKSPFDVLVSDMRMPGMNGVELLRAVMQRWPEVVRLILSGQADEQQILQCVGLAHQYLAKPCDPESLRSAIHRATVAGHSLNNPRLRQLLGRLDHLPSVPRLYEELLQKLEDPETTLEELAAVVARDPAMTAQILKLVNSAFFGLPHTVADIQEAVGFLGLNTLKTLVLALHAFHQYESRNLGWFPYEALWRHSLEVGARARQWAREMQASTDVAEQAAVAGLLHDVGQLVLAVNLGEEYAQIWREARQQTLPLDEAEQAALGTTHAEVGGYLLGLWGLPEPVVEAIAHHHQPGNPASPEFSALTAVHLAETLRPPNATFPEEHPRGPDVGYLQRLGLPDRPTLEQHLANFSLCP
ncbi:MAG: response regulator [Limisphaera sp.]